jgi:hypothetical protein
MLCEITEKQSIWIWNKLKEAHTYKSKIGEESITDFFVLELKKLENSGNYQINTFTHNQESKNGADWEIWLTGKSGQWLGLRVQAKVISLNGTEYKYLHYKNGIQTEKLIKTAKKNKVVPLYCLYSYWGEEKVTSPLSRPAAKSNVKLFGASILCAKVVKSLEPKKKLDDVINNLIPLSCLFCRNNSGQDLPTHVLNHLTRQGIVNNNEFQPLTFNEIPDYVIQILDSQQTDNEITIKDKALARVTIISEINNDQQDKNVNFKNNDRKIL